jgi:hypothetical protein
MNPAVDEAAKLVPTERPSAGAGAGSVDKLDEQLSVSVEALLHPSPAPIPVEDLDGLLSGISHHLDDETSERKAIHNRLLSIENEMERLASRGFRYLVAICIVVAAILAWQSYGEAAKQIIATRVPELGRSPETKQMVASWMQQLGWAKPLAGPENTAVQAAPVAQTAPKTVAPKAPAAPPFDPEQAQQIARDVAALRQTIEQLTVGQDQMAREIEKLQAADMEIVAKIPSPPPQPAAPARKTTPVHRAPKLAPTPFWGRLPPHP